MMEKRYLINKTSLPINIIIYLEKMYDKQQNTI